jgi:hypothetical protein
MLGHAWEKLQAGLMKASADGLLPENMIVDNAIECRGTEVCFDETEKLYQFLEVIQDALSFVEPLFADFAHNHGLPSSYLPDAECLVAPEEESAA